MMNTAWYVYSELTISYQASLMALCDSTQHNEIEAYRKICAKIAEAIREVSLLLPDATIDNRQATIEH